MTLHSVAKAAGVSPSTVSRVINGHPRVAPDTADLVRAAMEKLQFKPTRRARQESAAVSQTGKRLSVTLMVVGSSDNDLSPGFESLMRGVTSAANDLNVDLAIKFYSDPARIDFANGDGASDGYLIHGETPSSQAESRMRRVPCLWLMANRQRPAWGDQILPDNTAIGEIAANYLADRGHQHLAICNIDWKSWSMEIRSRSFLRAAQLRGIQSTVIDTAENEEGVGESVAQGLDRSSLEINQSVNIDQMVADIVGVGAGSVGLFVAEDRQVPLIYHKLRSRGLSVGHDGDVEIISCNNQRPHLAGLNPVPATIDIRIETIGYRGMEFLLSRLRNHRHSERIRAMVDPVLVVPAPELV